MWRGLFAVLMMFLVGCGAGAEGAFDDIEAEIGCESTRTIPGDDMTWACFVDSTQTITVSEIDDDSVDYFIAASQDQGEEGPWIVAEGYVVSFTESDPAFAREVQELVGGEIVTGP